jgi:superfamily II DNA helicase RecQ
LRRRGLAADALLSKDDAYGKNQLQASELLTVLCMKKEVTHQILFCTPEKFENLREYIEILVKKRFIKLIVVDEVDVVSDANNNYRSAYIRAIPALRIVAPTIQLFFLSATLSRNLIIEVIKSRESPNSKGTHLYQTRLSLPRNHVYSGKCLALD